MTGDVATDSIAESLLVALEKGKAVINRIVKKRFSNNTVNLHNAVTKSRTKTFASRYNLTMAEDQQQKIIKVDRDLFIITCASVRQRK